MQETKKLHTSPVSLNINCYIVCFFVFVDAETKAIMKERQKKDSHNLSEFDFSFISENCHHCVHMKTWRWIVLGRV